MSAWVRLLRPREWVKNLLVFVPLFLAHRYGEPDLLGAAARAFVAFSLVASAGYVINDLFDRKADSEHPRKRLRPLAAGEASTLGAGVLAAVCLGLGIATFPGLWPLLLGYFGASVLYSWRLKEIALIDIALLACFYAARLEAGSLATGQAISSRLLQFAVFAFASIAIAKRYAEVAAGGTARRRGYRGKDLEMLGMFGIAAAYVSVLIVGLYVRSEDVAGIYRRPGLLWMLCPILLYWFSRLWILVRRKEITDDPLLFVMRDAPTLGVGAAATVILIGAR